jgi:uncharacterized membrane protein YdjX (TVP38/TMEM64 family)
MEPASRRPAPLRRLLLRLAIAAIVLAIVAWLGHTLGHHLVAVENWVRGLGPVAPLAFLAALVVLALFCVPDTLFAVAAGVLFGLWLGTALIVAGVLAAASISFLLARRVLHVGVEKRLEHSPRLAAIRRAIAGGGLRLQFLLRLTPLNPVIVSYLLGTTGVRYGTFVLACAGLVPGLFVEVYFGYAAAHVGKVTSGAQHHEPLHTAIVAAGLVLCIAVMALVTRAARRELARGEQSLTAARGAMKGAEGDSPLRGQAPATRDRS